MRKLSERERELIGIILDFEKEHIKRSYAVSRAMGLSEDVSDLIPFERIERALCLSGKGDLPYELVYGYVNDKYTLDQVLEMVNYAINNDLEKMREWFEKYESHKYY